MSSNSNDRDLDVIGLKCPLPVLRAQKALRSMTPGSVLTIRATDPVSTVDFPHFCNESGNELLETRKEEDVLVFRIRKSGMPADPSITS